MRHSIVNFDYVSKEGIKFIQFGNVPVKWIMLKRKKQRCPLFLSSTGWNITGKRFGIMYGTTRKPLKIGGAYEGTLRNEGNRPGHESTARLGFERRRHGVQ